MASPAIILRGCNVQNYHDFLCLLVFKPACNRGLKWHEMAKGSYSDPAILFREFHEVLSRIKEWVSNLFIKRKKLFTLRSKNNILFSNTRFLMSATSVLFYSSYTIVFFNVNKKLYLRYFKINNRNFHIFLTTYCSKWRFFKHLHSKP